MKGRFIVLEGLDSSGKATQLELLKQRLLKEGFEVSAFDFPQYEKEFGKLVAKYLRGEYGNIDEVPFEFASLLYSLDRYSMKRQIEASVEKGNIVVSNRFSASNYAFQAAKFPEEKQNEVIDWLKAVESRLPQPDLTIFLDVSSEFTKEMINNKDNRQYLKGARQDMHEKKDELQCKARGVYLSLSKTPCWQCIGCSEDGKLLPKERIHEMIWAVVKPVLHKV